MKYQDFNFSDKVEVEELLKSSNQEIRSNAIIGMINGISDLSWVQSRLLELINDENFWVAKNAIVGLGDLARLYGTLDVLIVKNALDEIVRSDLKGVIKDTLEDFKSFL